MDCTNKSRVSYQTQNPSPVQPSNAQETPEESSKQPNKGNTHKRFLGVRQRPSGRWVAEIKDSSQKLRLWLGTYDREEEAAMAYDNAARLLRGRNARTNFSLNEMNMTQEGKFSLLSKNPRFYQLFRHAIMKSHAKSSSINTQNSKNHQKKVNDHDSDDFSTCVHETIFCSSHQSSASVEDGAIGCHGIQEQDGIQGFSLGGSRVYSTIHVAPSFSAASYQEKEEEEKKKRRHED